VAPGLILETPFHDTFNTEAGIQGAVNSTPLNGVVRPMMWLEPFFTLSLNWVHLSPGKFLKLMVDCILRERQLSVNTPRPRE